MNEAETRAEHIDPALKAAGWGVVEGRRIRHSVDNSKKNPGNANLPIGDQQNAIQENGLPGGKP
jgi:type I site-specific restriction endonuclease